MRALYYNGVMDSGVTITVAGEDVNYPATNLTDRRLSRLYKPAAAASQWIKFSGVGVEVDCIAIAHSIPDNATVTLEGNAIDDWSAPSVSESLTSRGENDIYTHFFSKVAYDYWRLTIDATTIFSIGGIHLGGHLVLPEQSLGGTIEDHDTSIRKISKSGQVYGTEQYQYRTEKHKIPLISHTQRAEMRVFWDEVGRSQPFYFQRWATRPDLESPMYCVLDQDGFKWKGHREDANKFETDISIREVF